MIAPLLSRLCVLLVLVSTAFAADEEILKEFKKYFRKFKETADRVDAVLSLEGVDTPGVVKVLLPILKDKDSEVVDASVRILGSFKAEEPILALLEKLTNEKNEKVRIGILRSLAVGEYSGITEAVSECLTDKSWIVRWRAIHALAATGDQSLDERILPLCEDSEVAVRCAALEALAHLRSQKVVQPAIEHLTDEDWQVRASAIATLGLVRHKDAIEPLIERMRIEEGRLVEDISKSLEQLTARSFGTRIELWERYWNTYKDRYEIPTDEEMARLRQRQEERKQEYKPSGGTSYHGIDTPSRSIVFVIDISGSMEHHVREPDRFKDGGYPSMARMDIVKTELARTVERLEPHVNFNILAFATDLKSWKKKLVSANVLNRKSAFDWASRLEPLGGESNAELARAGLVQSAGMEAGKTNAYEALMWALGADEEDHKKTDYDEVGVDTIFFLSDGRPTHGRFTDTDDVLREVREANLLRKIVIHTIGIGDFEGGMMKRLAEENGGVFVDLGR